MMDAKNAEPVDMFSLCDTMPRMPERIIQREQVLDLIDNQFEEFKVLCLEGVEGVGVTTALTLYAQRHHQNCASFFNNGWSRHLLNPQAIESCLRRQFMAYTRAELNDGEISLANCIYRFNKQTKSQNGFIYFVFDGLANIPAVYDDGIRMVLAPLFNFPNARFLFSGSKDSIKRLLPADSAIKQTNELLKFQFNDVEGYLKSIAPELTNDDIKTIYDLSGKGLARNLIVLTEKLKKEGASIIRDYYREEVKDFYKSDYEWIEDQNDQALSQLMALLTFSEIPLKKPYIAQILSLSDEKLNRVLKICEDYIEEDNSIIFLRSDDYRKYLREKLAGLRTDVELLMIDAIEKSADRSQQFMYLPALYEHVKADKQLVTYLTSQNVQHYLEDEKSQAALNEQCEYGYNACSDFESQTAAYFRFAINRSVSREIEKNELSDTEIEALISIGEEEQAYTLTQSVFLMEERLKCLLIIAQFSHNLSDAIRNEIDQQVSFLSDAIKFEFIPDKALELAKLMLPVKMEKALEIIDKIAKVTKDRQQIDRLYTAISLSFNDEGKSDGSMTSRADLANSKIEDGDLRKLATVMKSIMRESPAPQVVAKMKALPASSQLNFLRFWIPEHKKQDEVGEVVEYAVRLVIDTSQTIMPKVSLLRLYCKPLPDMREKQVQRIVGMLDAVVANIKYPTIEYVKLMILVIGAVVKYDKAAARDRLENLYLEILGYKDFALQAHCKSLILRDFEQLGDPDDVEEWIGESARELQREIQDDLETVLKNSAYHLKVVEGPISAMVCFAPDFINKVISMMNTEERKSRAYLHAAQEYVRQMDITRLDWKYFVRLFNKITYDTSDLHRPLFDLVNKITEVKNPDQQLIDEVKNQYEILKRVEQAEIQCFFLATLYVWLRRNCGDDEFVQRVKVDLDEQWELIDIPSMKVDAGYHIAKVLSKISMKKEAREYVSKAADVRNNQLLSSVSCLTAYTISFDLYAHTLGVLIRSKLWSEDDIDQFARLMEYDGSASEAIIFWSRVALEFYGINDIARFNEIMNKYVTRAMEKDFCVLDEKRILFNIAPALYLNSTAIFYSRLRSFDSYFVSACIESVSRYIQTKYPYPEYTSTGDIASHVPLEKKDFDILLDLMRNTKNENFIFDTIKAMSDSIINSSGQRLSREQKRVIWDGMRDVVNKCLPMEGGIKHDGYKIACLAMIDGRCPDRELDPAQLRTQIEAIDNTADQALLFAFVANYLKKVDAKTSFIERAVQKTESLDYTFDKFNRFTVCLRNAYLAAKSQAQQIADKMMASLKSDKNGSYSDYQRLLDLVRDNDEALADALLEKVDDDPVRMQYHERLRQRATSNKKIEAAKMNLAQVRRLTNDELARFFERQMECLIKKNCVYRDVDSTQPILSTVFENPITDMQEAVLFFIENLYQKNQSNHKYNTLLREIHQAIADNLKIVVAIASGTQDKLARFNRIMNEKKDENDGFIQGGEAEKGVKKIVDWFKKYRNSNLWIIDPYFGPEDLYIIKALMDENNQLKCSILTGVNTDEPLGDSFQRGWAKWSSDLTGRIEIKSCCYANHLSKDGSHAKVPFHDRWWLLFDGENDSLKHGLRLASPSTMGSRTTEISEMDQAACESAALVFKRFFQNMVPMEGGNPLKYEEAKLR